jgi:(2Fe-2S) ferredoxin
MATKNLSETRHHVLICNGGSCMKQGAEEVTLAIRDEIKRLGFSDYIHTTRTRCNGRCEDACVVIIYPEGVWYQNITPELGREVVKYHLLGEEVIERYVSHYYESSSFVQRSYEQE